MLDPFIQIGKVWVLRPLNWLVLVYLVMIALSSVGNRRTKLEKAYNSPRFAHGGETISSSETLLDTIDRGEVNDKITGLDLLRIGSVRRENNLAVPISEIGESLGLFPNLKWIHFSYGQLDRLRPGALAKLQHLESIEVADSMVTQAGLGRLAEASSLSWLVIESSEMEGSLSPLTKLPRLKTLELGIGLRPASPNSERLMFRGEVLASIGELKHLERVAIDHQWKVDSDLQEELEASLVRLKELNEVWIGSHQTPAGRDQLGQMAALLPDVSVQSARYDFHKISTVLTSSLIGIFLLLAAGNMLTSHFSTPQAMVIPGYARPHRRFFFLFVILASAIGVRWITSTTTCALLPCMACAAFMVALAMLCLVQLGVYGVQNSKALVWLPFLVIVGIYGLLRFQETQPSLGGSLGGSMDRFLIGLYPVVSIAILVASIACVVWSLRQFSDQHRFFAESSLPSVVTIEDIKLYQAARYARQNGTGAFERKAERWERQFDTLTQRLVDGDPIAKAKRWAYGGAAYDAVRRFGLFALPITLVMVALPWYQSTTSDAGPGSGPGSLQMIGLMVVGYMIAAAALIPVVTLNHDPLISSMELLRPVTREEFVREKFTLAFLQVAGCLAFTFVYGSLVASVAYGIPSIGELLARAAMFAVTAVFVTSLAMMFCLIKNVFFAAFLVLIELVVIGTVAFAFVDSSLGGKLAALGPTASTFRLLCGGIAITLAAAAFLFSRRLWNRMEFGRA